MIIIIVKTVINIISVTLIIIYNESENNSQIKNYLIIPLESFTQKIDRYIIINSM